MELSKLHVTNDRRHVYMFLFIVVNMLSYVRFTYDKHISIIRSVSSGGLSIMLLYICL